MFEVNDEGRLILNDELGELLTRIQRQGNKDVSYQEDIRTYGQIEKWAYPKEDGPKLLGDCEDFSIYKRKLLMDAGVPGGALLLTICKNSSEQGHCVLCVVTNDRDFIMCNAHETLISPSTMRREGYTFLYRQQLGKGIDEPWDVLKK